MFNILLSFLLFVGDNRANAHPMLTVLQTILLRLHNIIVKEFRKLNPKWDDEKLFQETRRLVIAMEQHITFKYYLPNLLGMILYVFNLIGHKLCHIMINNENKVK